MRKILVLLAGCAFHTAASAADLEWIRVADDGKSFVQQPSGKRFIPWGVNYDHDRRGRLLEDYWIKEWADVVEDFHEIKELGANVVRIHLQFGKFMNSPNQPNERSLAQLDELVQLAADTGLYLDLTGLACYHKRDVPQWYDALDEQSRWDAQTSFWKAVAQRCADKPAVFFYDLMNEPSVPGDQKQTEWLAAQFFGKYYGQRIALDNRGRPKYEVANAWINQLVRGIREHDTKHLITVGMLDDVDSGFVPEKVGENLDFIAVHIYPHPNALNDDLKLLSAFRIGKPLVIEEIYPLRCSVEEATAFINASKPSVNGWISFYWGQTADELRTSDRSDRQKQIHWLQQFAAQGKTIAVMPAGKTVDN